MDLKSEHYVFTSSFFIVKIYCGFFFFFSLFKMVEAQGSHDNMLIKETNKLVGINNYYIWKIKMKVVLRK